MVVISEAYVIHTMYRCQSKINIDKLLKNQDRNVSPVVSGKVGKLNYISSLLPTIVKLVPALICVGASVYLKFSFFSTFFIFYQAAWRLTMEAAGDNLRHAKSSFFHERDSRTRNARFPAGWGKRAAFPKTIHNMNRNNIRIVTEWRMQNGEYGISEAEE